MPKNEGPYRIIIKYAGKEIPNSPFLVNVEGAPGDPRKVTVSGPGIEENGGNCVGRRTFFNAFTKSIPTFFQTYNDDITLNIPIYFCFSLQMLALVSYPVMSLIQMVEGTRLSHESPILMRMVLFSSNTRQRWRVHTKLKSCLLVSPYQTHPSLSTSDLVSLAFRRNAIWFPSLFTLSNSA